MSFSVIVDGDIQRIKPRPKKYEMTVFEDGSIMIK